MNTTKARAGRIVMVDDEPDFLAMARSWLEPRYDVTSLAETEGEELADVIASLNPDLVILDIHMNPDGFSLCRRLRRQPMLKYIPIIFLTASHSDADFLRALDVGGAAYMTKPLSGKELAAKAGEMIAASRGGRA